MVTMSELIMPRSSVAKKGLVRRPVTGSIPAKDSPGWKTLGSQSARPHSEG